MGMPMPGPQHDMMRQSSGSHHQQYPPGVKPRGGNPMSSSNSNNAMGSSSNSGGRSMNSSTGWQSDKDTPHRREMIQHMYVPLSGGRSVLNEAFSWRCIF